MTDKIDEAIAAAAAGPDISRNVEVGILITTTGRAAMLSVPPDLTDAELLELLSYFTLADARGLRARLKALRGPQLVVARGLIT